MRGALKFEIVDAPNLRLWAARPALEHVNPIVNHAGITSERAIVAKPRGQRTADGAQRGPVKRPAKVRPSRRIGLMLLRHGLILLFCSASIAGAFVVATRLDATREADVWAPSSQWTPGAALARPGR